MVYKKGAKNFYAEVDSKINNAFVQQCKKRGQLKNDTINAAMKVWLSLPQEIQSKFMQPNIQPSFQNLLDNIEEHQIMEELRKIPLRTKAEILQKAHKKTKSKQKKIGAR